MPTTNKNATVKTMAKNPFRVNFFLLPPSYTPNYVIVWDCRCVIMIYRSAAFVNCDEKMSSLLASYNSPEIIKFLEKVLRLILNFADCFL